MFEYRGEKDMEVIFGNFVLGSFLEVLVLIGMKMFIFFVDGFFVGKVNYFYWEVFFLEGYYWNKYWNY